jgi:hypothetical protein
MRREVRISWVFMGFLLVMEFGGGLLAEWLHGSRHSAARCSEAQLW